MTQLTDDQRYARLLLEKSAVWKEGTAFAEAVADTCAVLRVKLRGEGVVVQDAWLQAEVERYCEQWVLKSLEDQLEFWHEFWLIKAESDSEQEYSERVMAQLAHLRGRREKAGQEVMLSSEAGRAFLLFKIRGGAEILAQTEEGRQFLMATEQGQKFLAQSEEGRQLLMATKQGQEVLAQSEEGKALLAKTPEGRDLLAETEAGREVLARTAEGQRFLQERQRGRRRGQTASIVRTIGGAIGGVVGGIAGFMIIAWLAVLAFGGLVYLLVWLLDLMWNEFWYG